MFFDVNDVGNQCRGTIEAVDSPFNTSQGIDDCNLNTYDLW